MSFAGPRTPTTHAGPCAVWPLIAFCAIAIGSLLSPCISTAIRNLAWALWGNIGKNTHSWLFGNTDSARQIVEAPHCVGPLENAACPAYATLRRGVGRGRRSGRGR